MDSNPEQLLQGSWENEGNIAEVLPRWSRTKGSFFIGDFFLVLERGGDQWKRDLQEGGLYIGDVF